MQLSNRQRKMMVWRLVLFSGLVVHKVIWELLKTKSDAPSTPKTQAARTGVKSLIKLAKVAVLAGLAVQTLFLNLFPFRRDSIVRRALGGMLFLAGLATAVAGRLHLGDNWANIEDRQVLPQQSLVTEGIYRLIRHPIYTGDMLLLVGVQLALNSRLVFAAAPLIGVTVRQAIVEESILAGSFPTYQEYRKRTKRFVPYIL
jgi:protein-S-isoprenylcysteine O-methyltransferase Ste14